MHHFTWLDVALFLFVMQFIFSMNYSTIGYAQESFMNSLKHLFDFNKNQPNSYWLTTFLFITLLTFNLGGFLPYSFPFFSMAEFTLVFSMMAWMTAFLTFISSERFSLYLYKKGYNWFKAFFLIPIELVSEFSRPLALTVRLTANVLVGHMLMSAVYYMVTFISKWFMLAYIIVIPMEFCVLVIQSYIFARLVQFYLNE
uniref:ATP synthase subunit a n=1 Tax=Strongyloides papillosus TaxID=174720 RepID=A0A0S3M454_STREA|nr:ATP synthase F0 subunit 6 [Strongyloides papillosus]BAT21184.1 ATP synthase F0 subunit 6 [Strongyloides papillosus]